MEVHDSKLIYVTYICGKGNCGKESKLKANDAVKCTVCGYRILYKKRIIDPKEPIQYEAIWGLFLSGVHNIAKHKISWRMILSI